MHGRQEGLATAVQPDPVHDTWHQYAKNNPKAQTLTVNSTLIVGYCHSKIPLVFCKDCKIFCEGVKAATAKLNGLVGFGFIDRDDLADHNGLVNRNELINHNGIASHHNCIVGCNDLVDHIGLVGPIGHNGLDNFIGLGLVGIIGLSLVSLIGKIGLSSVIGFGLIALSASAALLAYRPWDFAAGTHQVGPVGCTSPNSFNGVSGLIGQISLVGQISLIRLISHIIGLIGLKDFSLVSLIGPSGISGLVDHTGLDFIGRNGLFNFMGLGLVGFIGLGFVDFTSLGLISLVRLIGHISLISLGGFSGINGCSLVELIGHISLVSFIGFNGWLARARKKMWWWIASFGYSDHNDVFKYHLATAILAAAAETIPPRWMQAAHGVATMSSATKISNAAIHFYCKYYAHLFVRESLLWNVLLHIAGLNSFFGNALQKCNTIIFRQNSANDQILRHEGVGEYPLMDISKWWLSI
jgi:hypothetical protein